MMFPFPKKLTTIPPLPKGDQENVLIPFVHHYFPYYSISKPEYAFNANHFVVGWGHASNEAWLMRPSAGVDEDTSHLLLSSDLAAIDEWLRKKTKLKKSHKKKSPIEDHQWNAMILLVYIIGTKNFLSSDLYSKMIAGERVFDLTIITDEWAEIEHRDSPPKLLDKMLLTVEELLAYNRLLFGLVTAPDQTEFGFKFPFSEEGKAAMIKSKTKKQL